MLGYEQNCLAVNNVYNQTTAACFLKRRSSDCFQVDCKNSRNINKWFVYTPFPQLYFLCSSNGAIMFKCPRETDVFDLDLKRCEFECREAGRFAHPNVRMYYECAFVSTSKVSKNLSINEHACLIHSFFHSSRSLNKLVHLYWSLMQRIKNVLKKMTWWVNKDWWDLLMLLLKLATCA